MMFYEGLIKIPRAMMRIVTVIPVKAVVMKNKMLVIAQRKRNLVLLIASNLVFQARIYLSPLKGVESSNVLSNETI